MERIDRRETVASRQRCDFRAMDVRERIRHHDQATIRLTGQRSNDGFEFGCVANRGRDRLYSEGRSSGFEGVQEIFGNTGLNKKATRATRGAISLSSSSHLPAIVGSILVK